jgi:hypothetical protein
LYNFASNFASCNVRRNVRVKNRKDWSSTVSQVFAEHFNGLLKNVEEVNEKGRRKKEN